MPIPVIDLFAGPGGLGEGFSSLLNGNERVFKIKLSIEKDPHAHNTLELRAFYREFPFGKAPQDYYDYLAGKISREKLFLSHPQAAMNAKVEAWLAELGSESTKNDEIDVRIQTALNKSENWALIGGPPCQAYSLAGRSRIIGGEGGMKKYEADARHTLYLHYLRILATHRPPVFVMENVKGLLSAQHNKERIFERILSDLKNPKKVPSASDENGSLEYKLFPLVLDAGNLLNEFDPEDFVIHCEKFGVPQARHRIIILGIRSDIKKPPGRLNPQKVVPIEDVLADLPRLRSGLSKQKDSSLDWSNAVRDIIKSSWLKTQCDEEIFESLLGYLRRIKTDLSRGGQFLPRISKPGSHTKWFHDEKQKGVCNHETRGHIKTDLHRYLFSAVFARVKKRSPLLEDFPKALLPEHENVKDALKETKFNDRFRVQMKGRPSTTVVSHIAKDGHYYIHYDPLQCRSLTVREAARLQTFPDNYFFEGPRTEQYKQVGNAVPPFLAFQIAKIVADILR